MRQIPIGRKVFVLSVGSVSSARCKVFFVLYKIKFQLLARFLLYLFAVNPRGGAIGVGAEQAVRAHAADEI